jgi:DNA repair protein RadA/Sms
MLLAVLEKRAGMHLGQFDVFVNIAGGVRVDEPAADLGVAVSVVSSIRDHAVDPSAVTIGEVGLGGEIRASGQIEKRIQEARKLGFRKIVLPSGNMRNLRSQDGVELVGVETVDEAIRELLNGS